MYLTKLLMKDFGKFHNKGIDLSPGINVITGGKDSGKSTVRDFLIAMIYGIDRKEGITRIQSNYEKRKPADRSGYSGTAYIRKDGSNYLVERNFLAGARKTSVLDVQSGRELRVAGRDSLVGTLVETGRSSFRDVRCISSDTNGRSAISAADHLESYLGNITLTGSAEIDKKKAIAYLQNEKQQHLPRPLIRRLDELTKKIEEYDDVDGRIESIDRELKNLDEEFVIEAEKRKRVARRLVENEDGSVTYQNDTEVDDKIKRLTESRVSYSPLDEDEDTDKGEKLTDKIPVIIGTGILVVLIIMLIVNLLGFDRMIRNVFTIITIFFVIFTIIDGLRIKGYFDSEDDISTPTDEDFKKVLSELQDENEKKEELEFDMTFAREYQEKKEALKKKEAEQIDRRAERARLRAEFDSVFTKKSELEDEIKAIDLAISRINSLSDKYKKDAYESFLVHISEMIPSITRGRYKEVDFDDAGNIIVISDTEIAMLDTLPVQDVGRISIAIRLAAAKYLVKEPLPLVIDGTSGYIADEEDARVFADCLIGMNEEQIIILTDDKGISSGFRNAGIQFNEVVL